MTDTLRPGQQTTFIPGAQFPGMYPGISLSDYAPATILEISPDRKSALVRVRHLVTETRWVSVWMLQPFDNE